ncbi:cytochrome C biogenesis protein [Metasolibacillus meyeri]|uniref:cytochrome C biogenesis protein n=1 Tax=Metasolibacillus meyeri TaxID=1071052 RepID=UPI000D2FE25B|nr:cytochrome C biogenesis protein [Metasolibacillus meyeri]
MKYVKIEVLLPEEYIEPIRNELNQLGVLTVGHYDHVVSYTVTKGYWRPLETATPYNGGKGEISFGMECKMEFRCNQMKIKKVLETVKSIHPYEEPIINIIPLLNE